ncbi:single-stranded DNA-binding protein [Ferruginibacter albus]|uniref:single-stranded DNA-binding protein n=1 Tax=Ferruginibacter albus TaxID=2875540 RepID=UPI001CC60DB5|nr:single-stranded DNA-binding protein [Ferruginibacter albus]UAY51466.1 single-stranded DNA-binding protein [Ferruginibacter albus]
MIKLQIVGNLGKDCIVKEVNGKNVINFSVAHTERFKDSTGNLKERTTWVECAYWTDRTAVAQYLKKGKTVYAEGAPEADAYMNKENQAAATLRMRVQNLQLLGGNDGTPVSNSPGITSASASSNTAISSSPANEVSVADDLPF